MTTEILLIKKGDLKTGFFSKKTAGDFLFFQDKIIFYTRGLSRIFNNAPITFSKSDMIGFTEGVSIFGYSIKLRTKVGGGVL
jgi:hypothetical protein